MSRAQAATEAPATASPAYLSRDRAAAWFAARGFQHITAERLRKLAVEGRGPEYSRLGKFAYYAEADLAAWVREALRPATEGRAVPVTLG